MSTMFPEKTLSVPLPNGVEGRGERISAAIIAFNEEEDLPGCLESLSWCDEVVVVVDDKTTDDTAAVARKYTEKVFVRPWLGWSAQKNFAFERCTGEWILSIDADERVPAALREEIQRTISEAGPIVGYFVARRSEWVGRWLRYGGWYPDYTLRLFRRAHGICHYRVHERIEVDGPTAFLQTPLEHYPFKTIDEHILSAVRATDAEADEMLENRLRICWLPPLDVLREFVREAARGPWDRMTLRLVAKRTLKNQFVLIWFLPFAPFVRFFNLYLLKQGFRDGIRGLWVATFSAFYTVLKYAKYWQKRVAAR